MRACAAVLVGFFAIQAFPQCNVSPIFSSQFRSTFNDLALDGNDLWAATSYGLTLYDRGVDPPGHFQELPLQLLDLGWRRHDITYHVSADLHASEEKKRPREGDPGPSWSGRSDKTYRQGRGMRKHRADTTTLLSADGIGNGHLRKRNIFSALFFLWAHHRNPGLAAGEGVELQRCPERFLDALNGFLAGVGKPCP